MRPAPLCPLPGAADVAGGFGVLSALAGGTPAGGDEAVIIIELGLFPLEEAGVFGLVGYNGLYFWR
jgi:hypothetical protein